MSEKRTIYAHVLAMGVVCLVCVGLVVALLFRASYENRRAELENIVQHRAHLVGEIVRHDHADIEAWGEDTPTGPVLAQALETYRHLGGFGKTGEFNLARPEGDGFVFLLGPRLDEPNMETVHSVGSLDEPMRRALRGESGTLVGPDYRGEIVLAAFAPVDGLGWGAVAKIDVSEIQKPFVLSGLIAALAALVAIGIIAFLFVRPMNILIRQLRGREASLAEMNERLVEQHSKMIQAAKLSSIGLLASGVAHEINNPLAGVKSCLKSLAENKVPDGRQKQYFDTAREGLDRIQSIVRRLLDYAKDRRPDLSPPHPATFGAADVMSSAVALVEPAIRKKQLKVESRIGSNGIQLQADRQQLTQALVNVLLNAVYAAPESSQIEVSALTENGRVGLRVIDHGSGILPEDLPRVCDPFFTTKPVDEGTGLGLAVTFGFVHAHGGELVFDSVDGSGTCVTIWLPAGGGSATDAARYPIGRR